MCRNDNLWPTHSSLNQLAGRSLGEGQRADVKLHLRTETAIKISVHTLQLGTTGSRQVQGV
ncbi:MAG: hypothetical protein DMF86_17960, partial [Acidobacteria bacterium]